MEAKENLKKGFGLFRNYGWKWNLLYIVLGFVICALLTQLSTLVSGIRLISQFNPSIAVMPLLGFLMGIWGVLGCLLEYVVSGILLVITAGPEIIEILVSSYNIVTLIATIIYCALPSMLWYAIPLKGEKRATYPRLDTSAHVVKYYLIMAVTVAIYIAITALNVIGYGTEYDMLRWAVVFSQNFDVVLIIGMPIIIIISVIRNRTITINERMVLAFLFFGIIASALGGALVYLTTNRLDPELFSDYDALIKDLSTGWTASQEAAFKRYNSFWDWYYVIIAVMLNVLLLVEMLFMHTIEKKVTKPILHLADVLEKYTDHGEDSLDPETVTQECRPYRYGYGEVSSLTRTCVDMVNEIDNYTENLRTVTAEKERIGTELDVASNIQRDMLPSIFPPFPERKEIDIYASMTPAKEVGGDFYDFYLIDHDHLALTIADVSGKGVPASLFMVISKTLLQNHAQMGGSPKEILTYVNHQLCQHNDSNMFCTVWLGILDLKNGHLIAANAGHEYPVIKRNGKTYELMKERHDPPLGIKDGLRYHEYELDLVPGDVLFQYTDGVTEATNAQMELLGDERMVDALNKDPELNAEQTINVIYKEIGAFVKDAPQFDDITMLCVKYMGNEPENNNTVSITVPARVDRLDEVNGFIEEQLEGRECPMDIQMSILLAVEEIFVNIASYAYEGREGEAEISFSFDESEKMAELVFRDSGIPYDPTSRQDPDITLGAKDRPIGGLGIHIVKKTMDEVKYDYLGGKNVLTIKKKI